MATYYNSQGAQIEYVVGSRGRGRVWRRRCPKRFVGSANSELYKALDDRRKVREWYLQQIRSKEADYNNVRQALESGNASEELQYEFNIVQAQLADLNQQLNQVDYEIKQLEDKIEAEESKAKPKGKKPGQPGPARGGKRISHAQAKAITIAAFRDAMGRMPTMCERHAVQVVSLAESQYGAGWKGEGIGSHNWGAVQAGKPPCNPNRSFLYTDSHPNPDGTSTRYQICFRRYPNHESGAADVVKILNRMDIFDKLKHECSMRNLSTSMFDAGYYEGFGRNREERINNHIKYLTRFYKQMTKSLGEPAILLGETGKGASRVNGAKRKKGDGLLIGAGVVAALGVAAASR